MKGKLQIPEPGVRVSVALIASTLVVIAFLQYFWFKQLAVLELNEARHSIASAVTQTFSREFQRYAPLVGNLRELAAEETVAPGQAKAALERLYGLYGPSGSVAGLVTSVGLASRLDMAETATLAAKGLWKNLKSGFSLPVPEEIQGQLAEGRIVFYGGAETEDEQFMMARAGATAIAVMKLDASAFFDAYIEPALASAFPGAAIEWTDAVNQDRANGAAANPRSIKSESRFDPILVLLGVGRQGRRTFSVSMPAAIDAYLMHGGGSFKGAAANAEGVSNYRLAQGNKDHGSRYPAKAKSVRIVLPEDSAIARMELRLSLVWLMGLLFLVGIGFSFASTIVQKHKLKMVGEREREFVASVTHELRTPVTAIKTAAFNMREGLVGPERMATYEQLIYTQAIRLGTMIEEMLLFSQVEGRKGQAAALDVIEVPELVSELRPPLDEIAMSSGIRLSWDFGALPKRFLGDSDAIRVIVSNLVANAVYHAYSGEEKGEVRVIGRISMPEILQFLVEDDGRGIPKAEAKLVFEPFYRDEASRARHEKGSGLGLFIASRKAEIIGGELGLESPYKRIDGARKPGCRFTLKLPYKEPDGVR